MPMSGIVQPLLSTLANASGRIAAPVFLLSVLPLRRAGGPIRRARPSRSSNAQLSAHGAKTAQQSPSRGIEVCRVSGQHSVGGGTASTAASPPSRNALRGSAANEAIRRLEGEVRNA
jgi:hypothetical protein